MRHLHVRCLVGGLVALSLVCNGPTHAEQALSLRLIPYPKEVQLDTGHFPLNRRLLLEISQDQAPLLGEQLSRELQRAGFAAPTIRPLKTSSHVIRLSTRARRAIRKLSLPENAGAEEYALQVQPNTVTIQGAGPAGLFYGVQTLRQLIRANRESNGVPALLIRDGPALGWRAFQDDLTRGPSSTLANLKEQVGLGALFKLNLFTYYMESQFAFRKHPAIPPPDGSLTPDELRALVEAGQPLHVQVLGNQQSFGHFTSILAHPEYSGLRETPHVLCPTNPGTYQLLDDLYSEVIPLLPFPYFNVCCDETDGLGEGPSKALAAKIGTGGVYVRHIRRVHELVTGKYKKRMMMWGDIILRHPDDLKDIPADTTLLTWAYDPRANFDDQITPFAKAGFEFWVCPGANGWNRILPDFAVAVTNIQNFVRDGLKQGARGMLNTAWDDDGETFNAPNWHAFAWGAECAWNASKTAPDAFNRRIGAALFGEKGDHFGRAIEALSTRGISGLPSAAFWQFNFGAINIRSVEAARAHWEKMLEPVRQALGELEACQNDATANAELLDFFIFGARRIELSAQRELDRLQAAVLYRNARRLPLAQALTQVTQAETVLRSSRDSHEQMARRFTELWQRENKPYAMDHVLTRYQQLIQKYDAELERLAQLRSTAKPDRSLPTPREAGLELVEESRAN